MLDNIFTYMAGIYLLGYTLIFFFPNLLHRKRTHHLSQRIIKRGITKLLSHRGGKEFFNENSLSAFENSCNQGTFGIELDVFSSRDKKMVVLHDRSLVNATGQNENIDEIDYEQIRPYKTQFDSQIKSMEKPPLFEDVLKLLFQTNLMINIDIKSDKDEDIFHVCELIRKHGFERRVVLGCIMNENCKTIIKELGLQIPTFFNRKECMLYFVGFFLGVLPFIPFHNDVIEIPFNFSDMQGDDLDNSMLTKVGFTVFNFFIPLLKFFNRHMNRRGIPVIYWTLNTEKDWETAITTAANGIITDFPDQLRRYLDGKKLFKKAQEID